MKKIRQKASSISMFFLVMMFFSSCRYYSVSNNMVTDVSKKKSENLDREWKWNWLHSKIDEKKREFIVRHDSEWWRATEFILYDDSISFFAGRFQPKVQNNRFENFTVKCLIKPSRHWHARNKKILNDAKFQE